MKKLDGKVSSIRELLFGARFGIDYYQREYRWERRQVEELIDDLTSQFLEDHDPSHSRAKVRDYRHYFLGAVITSEKEGRRFLIDGQQRLTTLTLLLIFLLRSLPIGEDQANIRPLIYAEKYGTKAFTIDVEEREALLHALLNNEPFETSAASDAVRTMLARYADIEALFPADLLSHSLPYFVDWLIDNVQLVEITAYSDEAAYTIFETMNDRGLRLTPAEMLKGFLLANIPTESQRNHCSDVWKQLEQQLVGIDKEAQADCIKAWLRAQHAVSIRERRAQAASQDFELIASEFHRWVKDHTELLGLGNEAGFVAFIQREYAFFTGIYRKIRLASEQLVPGLEAIYFNHSNGFTLQLPLMLSALSLDDPPGLVEAKLRLVANYVDISIHRRIWSYWAIDYSTNYYRVFTLLRDKLRRRSLPELQRALIDDLAPLPGFDASAPWGLTRGRMNRPQVKRFLARLTHHLERESGQLGRYVDYVTASGKQAYEVEHIWAEQSWSEDRPGIRTWYPQEENFREARNRIGALLLIPKSINASYGDRPYEEKRSQYVTQNALAQTFCEQAYLNNPAFKAFLERSGLAFQSEREYTPEVLERRNKLYAELAGRIWSLDRILAENTGGVS
ncbi:DUF262 domain-containing protein [Synechococcus sp. Cruz-9H2]|uniref:DUF262 domain-containing protein n=1 Tax=unclassified Synechococcus TaxID=2626047 RepID=UPI0020CBDAD3|nr:MULTISPECIES: DUF262 domain-containing protein [unclassified Synechococcus]MCP9820234.1 DUF262 domain-containing protein [Synechococcus sp. Cruz-9H2]MCP9844525.1 DUF262 domain-containing protein [Synechococcus sp. Edmonson 11F2]MCP9856664.1 DUF262 domain-containing protein [Synechococcus sp. Cruz-9C9]MCP9863950.1 DUF262 domain-containing protein [Synechococcus sp. Cruz-7E5]MCP9871129.1 DUF262 domain-containing protein [Synechococcus sp. Cruz-7B9]